MQLSVHAASDDDCTGHVETLNRNYVSLRDNVNISINYKTLCREQDVNCHRLSKPDQSSNRIDAVGKA